MKIIKPSYELYLQPNELEEKTKQIERAARTCYKSEGLITACSDLRLISKLISLGHEAMLEHAGFTVRFICDRGVSHELVRHRVAAYAQESTRYCNYSHDKFGNEITVIKPCFFDNDRRHTDDGEYTPYGAWVASCEFAEKMYFTMLACGRTPQEARAVLPNSTKTEVVATANFREWRHILRVRTDAAAHPQMRELMLPLLKQLRKMSAVMFADINPHLFDASSGWSV